MPKTAAETKPDKNESRPSGDQPAEKQTSENSPEKQAYLIIKSIIFILLQLGASLFLAAVCRQIADQYLNVLMAKPETLDLAIRMLAAFTAFVITSGLVAVLVKPEWLIYPVFAGSAAMYIFYMGPSGTTALLGVVLWGMTVSYALTIEKRLKNQIRFSMHPLSSANMMLILALMILFSSSLSLGYMADSARQNFVIPPTYRQAAGDFIYNSAKTTIENQAALTAGMKSAALDKARTDSLKIFDDLDRQLQSIMQYIPALLGIIVFISLESIAILFSWIPLLLLSVIFGLLKVTKVTRLETEMKEVSRLVI